ncbi:SMP-30/gluconolactonase/LRE family protein [Nocardia sp. AG03]|uniref:SMP-30/gluconolactonase/LRE family protein n=1 Tax=Nocardia sp. AG03 TaxID=3025312 RepID=UPI002418AC1A|nr:SMP-30/gluconolactonase/LRE family protein [Nocardia sp. AG03]
MLSFRRCVAHLAVGAAVVTTASIGTGTASAAPVASCAQAREDVAIRSSVPLLDWSENFGIDGAGNLWVARVMRGEVQRYDGDGRLTATVAVPSPGAVRLGPDGLLYVVTGNSPLAGAGGIVRFDPAAADPAPTSFATGFAHPNGAAFDDAGNLYVTASDGVHRLRRDGSEDMDWWSEVAVEGPNGIAVSGDSVYVTANFVADSGPVGRVLRLSRTNPADSTTIADLTSIGSLPDFVDDLVIRDGDLYVTTLAGHLVRVDPVTGTACNVLSTQPLTAVVADPDDPSALLAGSEEGTVLRIRPQG